MHAQVRTWLMAVPGTASALGADPSQPTPPAGPRLLHAAVWQLLREQPQPKGPQEQPQAAQLCGILQAGSSAQGADAVSGLLYVLSAGRHGATALLAVPVSVLDA